MSGPLLGPRDPGGGGLPGQPQASPPGATASSSSQDLLLHTWVLLHTCVLLLHTCVLLLTEPLFDLPRLLLMKCVT